MGGRRPPGPTPWIETLPVAEPGAVADGYYLFDGTATNSRGDTVQYPIVSVVGTELFSVWPRESSGTLWRYDDVHDVIEIYNISTSGIVGDIASQLDRYGMSGTTHAVAEELTKDMIIGKLVP